MNKMRRTIQDNKGLKFTEEQYIDRLINNIQDTHYTNIKVQLLQQRAENNLTLKSLTNQLINYHTIITQNNNENTSQLNNIFTNNSTPTHNYRRNTYGTPNKSSSTTCEYFNKPGHTEDVCYKKEDDDTYRRRYGDYARFCEHCKLRGHTTETCRLVNNQHIRTFYSPYSSRNNDEQQTPTNSEKQLFNPHTKKKGMILIAKNHNDDIDYRHWVADSGDCHHVINNIQGFTKTRNANNDDLVQVGNGETVKVNSWGTYEGYIADNDKQIPVTISNVAYIPIFPYSIISITKAIDEGATLSNTIITPQS